MLAVAAQQAPRGQPPRHHRVVSGGVAMTEARRHSPRSRPYSQQLYEAGQLLRPALASAAANASAAQTNSGPWLGLSTLDFAPSNGQHRREIMPRIEAARIMNLAADRDQRLHSGLPRQ